MLINSILGVANLQQAENIGINTVHFNRFCETYSGKSEKSFDELCLALEEIC